MTRHFDHYFPENVTNRDGSVAHLPFTSKVWLITFQGQFSEIRNDTTLPCGFQKETSAVTDSLWITTKKEMPVCEMRLWNFYYAFLNPTFVKNGFQHLLPYDVSFEDDRA